MKGWGRLKTQEAKEILDTLNNLQNEVVSWYGIDLVEEIENRLKPYAKEIKYVVYGMRSPLNSFYNSDKPFIIEESVHDTKEAANTKINQYRIETIKHDEYGREVWFYYWQKEER